VSFLCNCLAGPPRRFVVIREQLRAERPSLGRKLLEVPGYTFRVFVSNLALPPEEIWRDYNRRADMEIASPN